MELILIRHTAVAVDSGICYGQTDVPLRTTFEEEAADVLSRLLDIVHEPDIAVFCSPLSRCRKLARFCGFEEPVFEDRIMEMNFGSWEMQPFEAISDPQIKRWFDNWVEETPTGGESFRTMINRVRGFLDELQQLKHRQVILFTHGGVIACARICAGLCTPENAFGNPAQYGEIVRIHLIDPA